MLELADAVVVGGGVVGLAVTEALSRRYARVTLVEAARCGGRATAGGFAWVNASSKWRDEAYHRLNAEACRLHLALATEFDAARTGWNGGGSLAWVRRSDETAAAALDEKIVRLQSWDYPVVRLGRGEMQALEPHVRFEEDAVGMFAPSEGWVSTARLIRYYGELARERHASVAEFTQVTGFSVDHRGAIASVETSAGRVSTRVVVLCAGTETGALASILLGRTHRTLEVPVIGSPGLLAETAPLPAHARVHRVCLPAQASGFHLRPTPEGGLLLGADDTDELTAQDLAASRTSPSAAEPSHAQGATLLAERTAALLPLFDRASPSSTRTCIRPMPSDGRPIVGELPGALGVYVLVTHSGVTLAPLLGQLLADEIVTGRASPWLAPYRPGRFVR